MSFPAAPLNHGSGQEPTGSLVFAEDLDPGLVIDLGSHHVSREEIVEFSSQWDPQGFHINEALAAQGPFGGLIASGLHTMAVFQRLAVLGAFQHWAIVAGRTIREVRFDTPVRPDTTLHGELTVAAVLQDKPGRSLVRLKGCLAAAGQVVMTLEADALVSHRGPTPPAEVSASGR